MRDRTWAEGMAALQKSGLPGWPTESQESAGRADLYRRHLDDLSDDAWIFAVREAITNERWFPTVAALRDYASSYTSARAFLPEPRRTPEQVEADRKEARRGLELVKAAMESAQPVAQVTMPVAKAMPPIEASDERLAELRQQAEEIAGNRR